jgi:hypothetical protein
MLNSHQCYNYTYVLHQENCEGILNYEEDITKASITTNLS